MDKEIKYHGKNSHTYSTVRSKTYGVICMTILIFYLCRPLFPFIEYSIDKEYISKNLCVKKGTPGNCCQGKCYLYQQLSKNGYPLEANDSNKKVVTDQKVEDHLKSTEVNTQAVEKVVKLNCYYSLRYIYSFLTLIFIPPEV